MSGLTKPGLVTFEGHCLTCPPSCMRSIVGEWQAVAVAETVWANLVFGVVMWSALVLALGLLISLGKQECMLPTDASTHYTTAKLIEVGQDLGPNVVIIPCALQI